MTKIEEWFDESYYPAAKILILIKDFLFNRDMLMKGEVHLDYENGSEASIL